MNVSYFAKELERLSGQTLDKIILSPRREIRISFDCPCGRQTAFAIICETARPRSRHLALALYEIDQHIRGEH